MIALAQTTNTEIFAFIVVLVFKFLSLQVLFINKKRQEKLLKSRLLFKKTANFTDKLLQNDKQLECEIFRIFLKHIVIIYQCFFNLHDCTFKHV